MFTLRLLACASALVLVATVSSFALDSAGTPAAWSYRYGDETVSLDLDVDRAAVVLEAGIAAEDELLALEQALADQLSFEPLSGDDRQPYTRLWLVRYQEGLSEAARLTALDGLGAHPSVSFAAPVFVYGNALVIPRPELLVVSESGSRASFLTALEGSGLGLLREYPALAPTCLVAVDGPPRDVFERARQLEASPGIASATPNLIMRLEPLATPNDTLFNTQWAHDNTGQNGGTVGADMDSLLAWDVTTGSTTVKIAILDEGVDVDHEDLAANMLAGHDATNQAWPEGVAGNAAQSDGHGTACAGIAAAVGNNNLGVAGVNWNAKIIPIRIGYGTYWTETGWTIQGITWAADNGADVLSNSWGGGPPATPQENAIEYARVVGRNGLGCPVFFSTGNADANSVIYPGAYSNTIAVGATSPCDERKSISSCDGENWWGSNYGPQIDLVAPGVFIQTTDIMGSGGYQTGNYDPTFRGTSAATPFAAGAAALILAFAPGLRSSEVQFVLEESADDMVGVVGEDTPGWDQYMGWGRINLQKLVDYDMVLRTDDAQGSPGETGVDTYALATNDLELAAFSYGVDFDESVISCTAVDVVGTVPGSLGAEFVVGNFDNSVGQGWYTLAVVIDTSAPLSNFMFTGVDQAVGHAVFDIAAGATPGSSVTLELATSIGTPAVPPVLASIYGGSHTPVLLDGTLDVVAGGGTQFIRGDIDGDGAFNGVVDGIYLLNFSFTPGSPPPPCLEAGDTDDDSVFNGLVDSIFLLNCAFVPGSPCMSAPFPSCGNDPDPAGSLGCASHPGC